MKMKLSAAVLVKHERHCGEACVGVPRAASCYGGVGLRGDPGGMRRFMKAKILFYCAVALIQVTSMNADDKVEKHPTRDDVVGVDSEDKEMLEAQGRARDSLMRFVKAVQKREKGKRYLLKVKLSEGEAVEHVWLEPVKWNDPGLIGTLAVDPVSLKTKKKGDTIAPRPSEVTDWVILAADGTKEGGFTADVIEKRKAKAKESE